MAPRSTTKENSKGDDSKSANLTLVKGSKGLILANGSTKANPEALRRAAKQLGVEVPKARGAKVDADLLLRVREAVGKNLAALDIDDHVRCEVCEEVSTEATQFCPFCGDLGQENGEAVEAAPEEPEEDEAGDDDASDDDESEESSDDESTESDDDESEGGDDESDEDEEASDDDETEEKVDIKKPDTSVGIVQGAKSPVRNVDAALADQEEQLKARLDRIADLGRRSVGLTYEMGLEIREIRDQQLYKARGFGSFKSFAESELPVARVSALRLVAIVNKYTQEEYEEVGYAKLSAMISVQDETKHDELMEAAKAGASAREINARVTGKETPEPRKPRETSSSSSTPAKSAPEPKGDKITLIGRIGAKAQLVKLRDKEGRNLSSVGTFASKGLETDAFGEVEVSEGVFLRIALRIGPKNDLVGFNIRFVRADVEAE